MEKHGVPAILVLTEVFVPLARMVAAQHGLPEIRMIVIPPPLAGRPEPEVDQLATIAGADALALVRGERAAGP